MVTTLIYFYYFDVKLLFLPSEHHLLRWARREAKGNTNLMANTNRMSIYYLQYTYLFYIEL